MTDEREYIMAFTMQADGRISLEFDTLGKSAVREEVVRCKDCRYYDGDNIGGTMFDAHICWAWGNGSDYPYYTHRDGFCHRGERRVYERL